MALARDLTGLASSLAMGLTLDGDRTLRTWLRREACVNDVQPLFVQLGGVWAELTGGETRLHRSAPRAGARLDLFDRLSSDPQARQTMESASQRVNAPGRADALLEGLFDRTSDPTRSRMASLLDWSPLLEHEAYRFSARCASVLLDIRRSVHQLEAPTAPAGRPHLLAYWRLLLANAHVGLLATNPAARPWLSDMAESFTWVDWTPSRPFVQERSLWFGAVGARHAAAFGGGVLEPYLRMLAVAGHPLRAFDAAFGLAAIGLSEPAVIPSLLGELEIQTRRFVRQGGRDDAINARIVESAMLCLRDPDTAAAAFRRVAEPLGVGLRGESGLLSRAAIQLDMTTWAEPWGHLGLLGLPRLLQMTTTELYPARSPREPVAALGPSDIAAHIARAWQPGVARKPQLH